MALQSSIDLEGLSKEDGYWRVTSINWDSMRGGYIRVTLSGYASQQAYIEGKRSLQEESLQVSTESEEMLTLFNICRTEAYKKAKLVDKFIDAVDV